MSEWNSVISVVGTLGGLVVGYLISSGIEGRREKHEMSMEYRKELTKHMDDIIKPLYHLISELWGGLAVLDAYVRGKTALAKGVTMQDYIALLREDHKNLKEFCWANETQIDLLFPHPLSTWVFAPIGEKIDKIMTQILQGKEPSDEFTKVINALMKYQENLKKLIGYETKVKLENVYPFPSKK